MNAFDVIEEILLLITYSVLIVTVFVEYICYKRNLETSESIFFTLSLLFLVVNLSLSPLAESYNVEYLSKLFKFLSFILVGYFTPINVLTERVINYKHLYKKALLIISSLLIVFNFFGFFFNFLNYVQYFVVGFLGVSITISMLVLFFTKPVNRFKHQAMIDKIFAVAFMILVPISLAVSFFYENQNLKIGITLPIVFILLAGNKLMDDVKRLSLLNPSIVTKEQSFKNYPLTERENEIAILLVEGKKYKQISEKLFISLPTVKTHASNVYRKCGVNSRSELTALIL